MAGQGRTGCARTLIRDLGKSMLDAVWHDGTERKCG